MAGINRPIAGNANAIDAMRETLSGKADSVFSYRNVNPYSTIFDKLRQENNENLDMDLWQQATNKGELDQYINLLMNTKGKSSKLAELKQKFGGHVDYDSQMLALSYDAIKNDKKEDRYDSSGNLIGNYTQRELIDLVLQNEERRLEEQLKKNLYESGNFWQKLGIVSEATGAEIKAFGLNLSSATLRSISQLFDATTAAFLTGEDIVKGKVDILPTFETYDGGERANRRGSNLRGKYVFEDVAKSYAQHLVNKPDLDPNQPWNDPVKVQEFLSTTARDLQLKYSYSINPETGEYTEWGKILYGMADSIGYMLPSMIMGNPAFMYVPMFAQNVEENMRLSGPNVNYANIVENAAVKTGVEYAIEVMLGKVLGFSKMDKLMGIGDDAARMTSQQVSRGLTASTRQAAGIAGKRILKDALKEGIEEVLQETSGVFIDYLYGDAFADRAKEQATFETFKDAFVIGIATSVVIGSFTTLTVPRQVGVDKDGNTYKMGAFQSVAYNDAMAALSQWHDTALDQTADPHARLEALVKLQGVMLTLGNVYQSMGVDKALAADIKLQEIQQYHDKKADIKSKLEKGKYAETLVQNLDNEVDGANWKSVIEDITNASGNVLFDLTGKIPGSNITPKDQHKANKNKPVAFQSFTKALNNLQVQKSLATSGATEITEPTDLTKLATDNSDAHARLAKIGFRVVAKTDGRDVVIADDVIFLPKDMDLDADIQSILKEVVTQKTIVKILTEIDANLRTAVISVFTDALGSAISQYSEAEIANKAIAALMFDKNFQLKMLLTAKQNDATWGTKQVINFITNLKKMVAKKWVYAAGETSGQRILTDATKKVLERVETSLQESIVAFNTTVARNAEYNSITKKMETVQDVKNALKPEQLEKMETDKNVALSATLDAIAHGTIPITPQVKKLVDDMADDILYTSELTGAARLYNEATQNSRPSHNLALAIMNSNKLPSKQTLASRMLKILNTGTANQRLELVSLLRRQFRNNELASNKAYYIPVITDNAVHFEEGIKIKTQVERELLNGRTIESFINDMGGNDLAHISPKLRSVLELLVQEKSMHNTMLAPESTPLDTEYHNATLRFIAINELIKRESNYQYGILENGTLVYIDSSLDNIVDSIKNAVKSDKPSALLDVIETLRLSKPDKILRLQDFFTTKLGPAGNVIVVVSAITGSIGGHYSRNGNIIHVALDRQSTNVRNFTTILHEAIHAVNNMSGKRDFRQQFGTTAEALYNNLPDGYEQEIIDYVATNFPMISQYYGKPGNKATAADRRYYITNVMYDLVHEESTARSIALLYPYMAVGFTYDVSGDEIYLVAPNGYDRWKMKPMREKVAIDFKRAHSFIEDLTNHFLIAISPQASAFIEKLRIAGTLEEMKLIIDEHTTEIARNGFLVRDSYNDLVESIITDTWTRLNSDNEILIKFIPDLAEKLKSGEAKVRSIIKLKKTRSKDKGPNYLKTLNMLESTDTTTKDLQNAISEMITIYNELVESSDTPGVKSAIYEVADRYLAEIIIPLINEFVLERSAAGVYAVIDKNASVAEPSSFNFGEYSLVKHTGRTYMLTQQLGNGRYTSQEVDRQTLLPVKSNQKPLVDDEQRTRMLFVIAKKIDAAKKAEPTLPEPEVKKAEPDKTKKSDVYKFIWGPWTVKDYNTDNYIITKNVDRNHMDHKGFAQTQIVNKKTLLPDTMLNAKGKPILSDAERAKLLDWIAHEATPYFYKHNIKDKPGEYKYKFIPNLSEGPDVKKMIKPNSTLTGIYMFDNSSSSSIKLKDRWNYFAQEYLFTKASPELQQFVFSDIDILESILLLYNMDKYTIPTMINRYVADYLNTTQGQAVSKLHSDAKTLLIEQLTNNISKLQATLNSNPKLKSELHELMTDFEPDYDKYNKKNASVAEPSSFNFGEYSLVKHTGRTYMLTQQLGNGRYTSQEVDRQTLLPVKSNQKPLVDDEQRTRMLFVIAKKIEAAQKAEPEIEPEVKKADSTQTKPKPKDVYKFIWGPWTVKDYDDTHYVVTKKADRDGDDEGYTQTQVVSKKTLLPDTMLGAKGNPLLSDAERRKILDWIAHDTKPQVFKLAPDTPNERYVYKPNLTDHIEYEVVPLDNTTISSQYLITASIKTDQDNVKLIPRRDRTIKYPQYVFDFMELTKTLMRRGSEDLKAFMLRNADMLEQIYLMQAYNGMSTEYAINDYVAKYFNSDQGKAILKMFPDAKALLTAQITKAQTAFEQELRKNPSLTKELTELVSDYYTVDETVNASLRDNVPRGRIFVNKKRAAKSNLKYFDKGPGTVIQMHPVTADFVEGTTADFDKLPLYFKKRIENGTLTYRDIENYIHTTKSMNTFVFQKLAKLVYNNEFLSEQEATIFNFFNDKLTLETFAIIARLVEDANDLTQILRPIDFKKLRTAHNAKIDQADPDWIKKYNKVVKSATTWWTYDKEGKLTSEPSIIDEKQLLPIFMKYFDGTLASLNRIFTLAKIQSGKQQLLRSDTSRVSEDTVDTGKTQGISSGNQATEDNTKGVKTQGTKAWRWLDNMRRNEIDYSETGFDPAIQQEIKLLEELTAEEKAIMVEDYLYQLALDYTDHPTEQQKYEAQQDATEAMDNMTEAELDQAVLKILAEATNKPIIKIEPNRKPAPTQLNPDGPTYKTLKDSLRNKLRTLIRRLGGLKVAYNQLAPEVKALINFKINDSTINTEAYTNLNDVQLANLNKQVADAIETIKKTQQEAKAVEKTKNTIIRKVEALHKKERALAAKEERLKSREKALKEGTTLREKLKTNYTTKIADQNFEISAASEINPKLKTILDHTWDKTITSKVKYMNDSVQTIQNVHTATEFYKAHAAELNSLTLAEVEEVVEWLISANISDSAAKPTFEATRFFILAYLYNETGADGIFSGMNHNLITELGNYLKSVQTTAGTLLSLVKQVKDKLNPSSIMMTELFNRFQYELTDNEQNQIDKAIKSGDSVLLAETVQQIKMNALANIVPETMPALRKIAAIRSMSMISGPMTWVRNIISNAALSNLTRLSSKIGNFVFPKLTVTTEVTKSQYKLTQKVTKEISDFITEQFVTSGLFDQTIDQLNKYNPSQVLRHKRAGTANILTDMIIHSIYNQFYSESMFNSKILNNIHKFLMDRLSDKKWVREATIRYLGKMIAETNSHIDAEGNLKAGIDDALMKDMANAFAMATRDYMHSDNFFSHMERWLTEHSQFGWAVYKTIMPFATASWNWFKAAVRYSPIGLGQSIVKLSRLEQEITKAEIAWKRGESQVAPELVTYLAKRDFGSGVIGTIAFGFGMILAALGYVSLEEDDYGKPRLLIGNMRLNITAIFGSSSVLAGAALIHTLKDEDDLASALDAMLEPLSEGFFLTELLQMDMNSPKGWFEFTTYQIQSIILSFIPSMVRYLSGMTYTGTYKPDNFFQKAIARIPFMGQAFDIPKKTNIYTGDSKGTMWDIFRRAIPYFEISTKSAIQTKTEYYGLNKKELKGTYVINGEEFTLSAKERERINQLYGTLNANALTDFYANKSTYRVQTANGTYARKFYSTMTQTEITNALDQIFSRNSEIAKVSAWLSAGHSYYTTDQQLFNALRRLGYNKVYIGNKGFVK